MFVQQPYYSTPHHGYYTMPAPTQPHPYYTLPAKPQQIVLPAQHPAASTSVPSPPLSSAYIIQEFNS